MKLATINHIFNVSEGEWPRILIAWTLRFLFQFGFVIGWTTLISMFVARFSLELLPYLFIANAALIIVGTFLYSELIHRVHKETLIVVTALLAGSIFYVSTFFLAVKSALFFACILTGGAILLSQLDIMLALFIEELFTPLESERTFPLIESSHTIGGILAGVTITILAQYIPTYKFVYIWIITTLLIIPIIFSFRSYIKKLPFLELEKHKEAPSNRFKKFIEGYREVKNIPFLKGLLNVILVQWIFINLMEFQYINAIQTNIHGENSLAMKLGTLHIIFSASALLVQLFIASRMLNSLGIIGSMMLQPIVMLLNMVGLSFRFNLTSAVVAKTSFEITHVIYQNAYLSSYYSIKHSIRESAREFIDGLMKPMGAIIGMLIILNLENFFHGKELIHLLNGIMTISIITMGIILIRLREKYTKEAENALKTPYDHSEKLNAIEVLSQKGHKNGAELVTQLLMNPHESEIVKLTALKALGKFQDPTSLPEILDCLLESNERIKMAALETLSQFRDLGKHVFSQAFSKYRVTKTLMDLFQKEESEEIRAHIIQILANLKQSKIADFIIKTLQNATSESLKKDCIQACGLFRDPNAAHYIKPYIQSENPEIRAKTIIALWQFPKYRPMLEDKLKKLLQSDQSIERVNGIEALGEIGEKGSITHLLEARKSHDASIRYHAVIALAKLGHNDALKSMAELLLQEENSKNIKKVLQKLPPHLKKKMEKIVHRKVSKEVNTIFHEAKHHNLKKFKKETLKKLKQLYELVEDHQEVLKIENEIS